LQNKSLPIYGDGKQIRDWLYVEDHVRGIDLVLNKGQVGENYNIGGNNEKTNIEIVMLICQIMNNAFATDNNLKLKYPDAKQAINGQSEHLINYVKDRLGHDRRYAIDATKSNTELGYIPNENFETGINKTIQWYLKNDSWWKSIIDGSYQQQNRNI
jgi:dTDP-glucose 4,6-dehydratase